MLTESTEVYEPIHDSLLDTDYYQFLMLQLIYFSWCADKHAENQRGLENSLRIIDSKLGELPEPKVEYSLFQRGPIKLAGKEYSGLPQLIDENELIFQFDHIRNLRFSKDELDYLGTLTSSSGDKVFSPSFIDWLQTIELPEVEVVNNGTHFSIKVSGLWHQTLLWETYILNTVTELVTRKLVDEMEADERNQLDAEALQILEQNIAQTIKGDISFSEFGTRRRASKEWQRHVAEHYRDILRGAVTGNLVGTSNVKLAKELDLHPIGTMAHQLFMVFASYFNTKDDQEGKLNSQQELISRWWQLYGIDKSIWLPDTYTTGAFLKIADPKIMIESKGFRQDSGDPNQFAQTIYDYLYSLYKNQTTLDDEQIGAEIKKKVMLFSDGLTMAQANDLQARWKDVFTVSFGIGTSLTNNLGTQGTKINLAVKPTTLSFVNPITLEESSVGILKVSDAPLDGAGSKLTGDVSQRQRFVDLIQRTTGQDG